MEQPDIIIGHNLKRLREQHNMSYTQLADATGVSKSMLRQIEIGESSPTINTLWKIALGLEVPFSMLINPPSPRLAKEAFTERSPLLSTTQGYRLFPLVPFEASRNFEVYYVEVDAGVLHEADAHAAHTREFVLVTQGTLNVQVQGETVEVATKEILRFDADHPHYYHNISDEMAQLIMVISYTV